MEERNNFLKYSCPIMIVLLSMCLGVQNYSLSQQDELKTSIVELSVKKDSLINENRKLRKEIERIKSNQEQHIRLDVTSVSHHGGGVVVNKCICK